jgi:hypothetical protein
MSFGVLYHCTEGDEGFVDAAEEAESVLLVTGFAVCFRVLGAKVFDGGGPKF